MSTAPGPHSLPRLLIATTMLDCSTANTAKTMTFANRYAVVDNPTACSRRKMARSPMRARIVSAVPMKMAPTLSSTRICPGSFGRLRRPGSRGSARRAHVAGHRQRQHTHDERQHRQEDEVAAVGDDQPHSGAARSSRTAVAQAGVASVCRDRPAVSVAGGAGGAGPWRRGTAGCAASGSLATVLKMSAQFGGAHRGADLVGWARRTRSCRRAPAAAPGRTRRGRSSECVTTTTTRPASASWRSIVITCRSSAGSRPEVGSSRISSDGPVSSSIATDARLRWPPDSLSTRVSACCGQSRAPRAPARPPARRSSLVVSGGSRSSAA